MKKVYLFGDSITAGYYEQAITDLLTARLAASFPEARVVNAGIPGDTTVEGLARLWPHVLRYQPDVVTVFFGANDAAIYRLITPEDYEENLRQIIELIGRDKVVLLGPPYVNQRNRKLDRPLRNLEKANQVAAKLATEYQLPYIDLLTLMLAETEPESLLQSDGLHFSLAGYDFLAQLLKPVLNQKLQEIKKMSPR